MIDSEDAVEVVAVFQRRQAPVFAIAVSTAYPGLVVAVQKVDVGPVW